MRPRKPLAQNADPLVRQIGPDVRGAVIRRLAERSGVKSDAITNWITGQTEPRLSTFRAVAESLGYDLILVKKGGDRDGEG